MTRRLGPQGALKPPWDAFLADLNNKLQEPVELHCLGGFVLHQLYDLSRPTADIDCISMVPRTARAGLEDLAGRGSHLAKKHGVYLQQVGVADFPENYTHRLIDIAPRSFTNLRLRVFSVEDLVLAKLVRHSPKDLSDVRFLAHLQAIDISKLQDLYATEMRPNLVNTEHHDLTLSLWLDEIRTAKS